MLSRVLLAALAVAALVPLGLGLRAARDTEDAGATTFRFPPASEQEYQDALQRLEDSETWATPDPGARVLLARYLLTRDRHREALAAAESAAADEPDNIEAWAMVLQAGAEVDPARARVARERIFALNPLAARSAARRAPAAP